MNTQIRRYDFSDFTWLIGFTILLFGLAPLYYQPNLGGRGLELTFNISTWAMAVTVICTASLLATRRIVLHLPRLYLYFVAVPLVIILVSIFAGSAQPVQFFFRELFILGGLFFFFALFQFRLNQTQLEWLLLTVALSSLSHAVIGIVQVYQPELFGGWFATNVDRLPRGVFQQINVQVSFLATAVTICLYLLSRPIAKRFNPILIILILLSLTLNSFEIIYSGSRVGLLSLGIALPLLAIARFKQFLNNRFLVLLAIIAISAGGFLGKSGLELTTEKTIEITQGQTGSARINMYRIALELVAQKPILGHGIGNYLKVWNLQTGDYFKRNPGAKFPPYVEHPHNELVFWVIEGGVILVAGILAAIFAVVVALMRCGRRRAAGYIAMLTPITLHTQVELPFYISSVHWFLWLFLLFVVMRHDQVKFRLVVSSAALRLIQFSSISLLVGSLYFLVNTSRAQADISDYVRGKATPPYLEIALNNHYYRALAEEVAMRASLYHGISSDNPVLVKQYIEWSEKRIAIEPKLKLFEDLIEAYTFLNDQKSKCTVVALGLSMYPQITPLVTLNSACSTT